MTRVATLSVRILAVTTSETTAAALMATALSSADGGITSATAPLTTFVTFACRVALRRGLISQDQCQLGQLLCDEAFTTSAGVCERCIVL